MSDTIRKIWDAIKYGPEEKLVTYESPDKGKTIFIPTVNKRTGQVTRQRELIKENDDD